MLDFQERRIGTNKGIPTLFIASACFDNIIAITGNSAMIGVVFNEGLQSLSFILKFLIKIILFKGQLWWTIIKTPIQILLGIVIGVLLGCLLNVSRLSHLVY